MSLRGLIPALATLMLAAPARAAAEPPAGADGALRHVLELAGTIGPRKTGSDADRRAIDYVAREMEAAGLSVTRQEVAVAPYEEGERSVGSWNVIGELPGVERGTLVVAAHHDTHSASVPGANDDASGVGVLLEVARMVARRPHRLTYRFISFCAEEEGLLGSRDYVRGNDLSPVRAMIALELVGRGELLIGPVPDPPSLWAQRSLLRAAREAGARGVVARPLWTIAPRFLDLPFSADHEPFLDAKVPAFLLLGTYPAWTYHTVEDGVNGVRAESLDRAARVVDRLLQDFETAPPEREDDAHYLPVMILGRGVLVPSTALMLISCAALVGWGLLAIWRLREAARPGAIVETLRVVIVTGAATALGLSGLFLSEWLMERIEGARYPWMSHHGLQVAQAVVLSLFTSWLGLKLFRRIKPTVEPGPYLAAAFSLPVAWVAIALWKGLPEVAVFMAVPILMFLLSLLFESTGRKIACLLAAIVPFFLLLKLRDYRALVDLGGVSPPTWLLFAAIFVAVFPLALFLAHIASFQNCLHSRFWWWLSGRGVGLSTLVLSIALLGANAFKPPYDYRYRQVVRLRQRVELNDKRADALIRSTDLLRDIRLRGLGGRVLNPQQTTERIVLPFPSDRIEFTAEATPGGDPAETIVTTHLKAPVATDRISYTLSSRAGFRIPGRDDPPRHRYTFTEIAPRRDPVGTFRILLPEAGDLSVELRAEFEEDLLGLEPVSSGPRVFVHHATIEGSLRVLGPAASPPPRSGTGAASGG